VHRGRVVDAGLRGGCVKRVDLEALKPAEFQRLGDELVVLAFVVAPASNGWSETGRATTSQEMPLPDEAREELRRYQESVRKRLGRMANEVHHAVVTGRPQRRHREAEMRSCTACGRRHLLDDRYCPSCGKRTPVVGHVTQGA
jgi:hypothetical protein